jgi:hypothetical protein
MNLARPMAQEEKGVMRCMLHDDVKDGGGELLSDALDEQTLRVHLTLGILETASDPPTEPLTDQTFRCVNIKQEPIDPLSPHADFIAKARQNAKSNPNIRRSWAVVRLDNWLPAGTSANDVRVHYLTTVSNERGEEKWVAVDCESVPLSEDQLTMHVWLTAWIDPKDRVSSELTMEQLRALAEAYNEDWPDDETKEPLIDEALPSAARQNG